MVKYVAFYLLVVDNVVRVVCSSDLWDLVVGRITVEYRPITHNYCKLSRLRPNYQQQIFISIWHTVPSLLFYKRIRWNDNMNVIISIL